jgi:GNAT superfamily N-acetyltransferase
MDAECAELIANERCLLLVAEAGGQVIGFIEASLREPERPDEADVAWCGINNLAVSEHARRQGVARRLIAEVEAWASRSGGAQIRLDVFAFNAGARALNRALGYTPLILHLGKTLSR